VHLVTGTVCEAGVFLGENGKDISSGWPFRLWKNQKLGGRNSILSVALRIRPQSSRGREIPCVFIRVVQSVRKCEDRIQRRLCGAPESGPCRAIMCGNASEQTGLLIGCANQMRREQGRRIMTRVRRKLLTLERNVGRESNLELALELTVLKRLRTRRSRCDAGRTACRGKCTTGDFERAKKKLSRGGYRLLCAIWIRLYWGNH
jgi:hypothetical protein